MLPYGRYAIPTAKNEPMWINCQIGGGVLACDVFEDGGQVRVSFFWRSKNDIQKDSDAASFSIDYCNSMVKILPKGFAVNKKAIGDFRWEKKYPGGYTSEEIAKEVACVFHLFGHFGGGKR